MRLISDVLNPAFGMASFPGTTISLSQDPLAAPGYLYTLYILYNVSVLSSRLDLVSFAALFFSSSLFPASIPLFFFFTFNMLILFFPARLQFLISCDFLDLEYVLSCYEPTIVIASKRNVD